jgi:phage FluMu protein Com
LKVSGTPIRCHHCKKVFPALPIAKPNEWEEAKGLIKRGGGKLRVARWCPWCKETNMVEVPVVPSEEDDKTDEIIVFRDVGEELRGLPPKSGDGDIS